MADAREPDEVGSDLIERWLSHRQESAADAPRPRTYAVPRTGLAGADLDDGSSDASAPEGASGSDSGSGSGSDAASPAAAGAVDTPPAGTAPAPARAADSPAVEPSAEPPAASRTEPPADLSTTSEDPAPPARRAPVGLDEFEPVVIASVRRNAEAPVEKRSRLARFRRAGLTPDPLDDEAVEAVDEAVDEETSGTVPTGTEPAGTEVGGPAATTDAGPVPEPPPPGPAPVTGPAVELVDHRPAAATPPTPDPQPTQEPVPAPEPVAAAEPATPSIAPTGQQGAAAEVFAAFNPGTTATAGPAPTTSTGTATGTATGAVTGTTGRASAPTSAPDEHSVGASEDSVAHPPAVEPPARQEGRGRPSLRSYAEAARTTLDRSVRGMPEERTPNGPAPTTTTPTESPASDAPATWQDPERAPEPAPGAAAARSAYDELRAQREAAVPPAPDELPPSIDFHPRTLARRVTSALLVLGLVATGVAAWRAFDSRVETDIGLAAILALATGVVWAVRAGSVPTRVSLHGGVLEVRSQAGRFVFEVHGAHTRLEVVGTPGRRGSRLLVHRRGLSPFALTPAMVDLRRLVEALRYYRPDL